MDRADANTRQVGGSHYRAAIQHWDFVASNNLDYFQGQITKYVTRWKGKNGIQDLLKAQHFLDKYIQLQQAEENAKRKAGLEFRAEAINAELKGLSDGEAHEKDPRVRQGG